MNCARSPLSVFALLVVLGSLPGRANAQPAETEAPVELPSFQVEVHVDPKLLLEIPRDEWDWRIGQVGDLVVLSSASDEATDRLTQEFLGFAQLVEWLIPQWRRLPGRPLHLVLCGARDGFEQFRPQAAESDQRDAVTAYFHEPAGGYIVADLQARTLELLETHGLGRTGGFSSFDGETEEIAANMDSGTYPVEVIDHLRRTYIRDLMTSRDLHPPAWLSEGLAQLVATISVDRGKVRIGKLSTVTVKTMSNGRSTGSEQYHDLSLFFSRRALLPLLELFAVDYDSPLYLNPIGSTFSGQSLGFVHYCLFGEKGRHQAAFLRWIDHLRTQPPTEEAFTDCFGMSTRKMNVVLRGYFGGGRYQVPVLPAETLPPPPPLELAAADPADVARLKTDLHRLGGRLPTAQSVVDTAVSRGFVNADLLEAAGHTALARGEASAAIALFAEARRLGSHDPFAHLAAARATLQVHSTLTGAEAQALLHLIFQARTLLPTPRVEPAALIADVLLAAGLKPDAGFLTLLEENVRLHPRHSPLCASLARLYLRVEAPEQARSVLTLGLQHAARDEDRLLLSQALKALDLP